MTEIFLHPPFDEPGVIARILGAAPGARRPAVLDGHALRRDDAGVRMALVRDDGGRVAGHVFALSDAERARLDFAMAAFGATREAATVQDGASAVAAEAYRSARDPMLGPAGAAEGEALARLVEAVDEVMGHFGRRAAEEMPGLLGGIGTRALARARGPGSGVKTIVGSGFGPGDVESIGCELSYARYFGVEEHRLRHRRFDGGVSETLDRAVFTSGDAVTVVPFDPRAGSVLLIEQFRAGLHARRDPHPWCIETVAGRCDRIEPPEATARREAREEAGLELGRLERIASYYPSPGTMAEFITAFVGEADLGAAGGTHGLAEEHEDIRAIVVPLELAMAALAAGEIRNAPLMLSLYWLERNAGRLRAEWT